LLTLFVTRSIEITSKAFANFSPRLELSEARLLRQRASASICARSENENPH
jgi:hypothetical protein